MVLQHLLSNTKLTCDIWAQRSSSSSTGPIFAEEIARGVDLCARARSTFVLQRVESRGRGNEPTIEVVRRRRSGLSRDERRIIQFGDDFRICCNGSITYDKELDVMQAPLFLCISPQRPTNTCEVYLTRQENDPNTIFQFEDPHPAHPTRKTRIDSSQSVRMISHV